MRIFTHHGTMSLWWALISTRRSSEIILHQCMVCSRHCSRIDIPILHSKLYGITLLFHWHYVLIIVTTVSSEFGVFSMKFNKTHRYREWHKEQHMPGQQASGTFGRCKKETTFWNKDACPWIVIHHVILRHTLRPEPWYNDVVLPMLKIPLLT